MFPLCGFFLHVLNAFVRTHNIDARRRRSWSGSSSSSCCCCNWNGSLVFALFAARRRWFVIFRIRTACARAATRFSGRRIGRGSFWDLFLLAREAIPRIFLVIGIRFANWRLMTLLMVQRMAVRALDKPIAGTHVHAFAIFAEKIFEFLEMFVLHGLDGLLDFSFPRFFLDFGTFNGYQVAANGVCFLIQVFFRENWG